MKKRVKLAKVFTCSPIHFLLFAVFFLFNFQIIAQNDLKRKFKLALFAPLYLDSAFDVTNNYKFGDVLPRYINPGLEFYEGAQLALDSLSKEGIDLEVFVFDTRSVTKKIPQQLAEVAADSVQMMIAYSGTVTELQQMAVSAQQLKIPFISANLPNDGGVYNNPFFVMLNATLRTHVESVYRFVQKYYPLDDITVFRKKGQAEDLIKSYIDDYGKNTMGVPLKLKYVDLVDTFSVKQIADHLDSNRHSLCIAGSLDESFGIRLAQQLALLTNQYDVTLIGMPTFEDLERDFSRPEFKNLPIIYGTSFYSPYTDKISQRITDIFVATANARPSDMVMRGYEAVWHFVQLLAKYRNDISSNLTNKEFNVFREFDIQPAINKKTMTLDYFENRKLFFVTWLDGKIKSVN